MDTTVAATFVSVMAVVLAGYWFFVVRAEGQEKRSVIKRLKGPRLKTGPVNVARAPESLSSIPFLDALLSRRRHVVDPLKQLLVEAGLDYTIGVFLLASFVLGAIVGVILWMVFKIFALSLVLGATSARSAWRLLRSNFQKRLILLPGR